MEENASSTEALTRKLDEILTETENDAGQFCFKEETVEKFMQELYKEIIASPPTPSNAVQVQNDSVGLQVVIGEDKTDEGHFDESLLLLLILTTKMRSYPSCMLLLSSDVSGQRNSEGSSRLNRLVLK
ncbi:hypothetical protein JHK86_014452 [Glycine max]|nr:hypothetical protein JHK86_014452 [Glycine max]